VLFQETDLQTNISLPSALSALLSSCIIYLLNYGDSGGAITLRFEPPAAIYAKQAEFQRDMKYSCFHFFL